jgi:hypothetical protein
MNSRETARDDGVRSFRLELGGPGRDRTFDRPGRGRALLLGDFGDRQLEPTFDEGLEADAAWAAATFAARWSLGST